jgi:hypothetical protein
MMLSRSLDTHTLNTSEKRRATISLKDDTPRLRQRIGLSPPSVPTEDNYLPVTVYEKVFEAMSKEYFAKIRHQQIPHPLSIAHLDKCRGG